MLCLVCTDTVSAANAKVIVDGTFPGGSVSRDFYLYGDGALTTGSDRFTVTGSSTEKGVTTNYSLSGLVSVAETTTGGASYQVDLSYSIRVNMGVSLKADHRYAFLGGLTSLSPIRTVSSGSSAYLTARDCYLLLNGKHYEVGETWNWSFADDSLFGNWCTLVIKDTYICNVSGSSTTGGTFTLGYNVGDIFFRVYDYGEASSTNVIDAVDKGTSVEQEGNEIAKEGNELQKEQNETTKNIFDKISDFFGSFFENIINAFKSLFIPEDDYFSDFFQRLNDFFADKLGMLYAPIDLFIRFLTAVQNAGGSDTGIPFPGVSWDGVYIIEPQTISLTSIAGDFPGLQDKIYFVTDVMLVGAVIWLLQTKLKEVLQN